MKEKEKEETSSAKSKFTKRAQIAQIRRAEAVVVLPIVASHDTLVKKGNFHKILCEKHVFYLVVLEVRIAGSVAHAAVARLSQHALLRRKKYAPFSTFEYL